MQGEINSNVQRPFMNITRDQTEPDNEKKFQGVRLNGPFAGHFDEDSCLLARMTLGFKFDYKTCTLTSIPKGFFDEEVFVRKDCGYSK